MLTENLMKCKSSISTLFSILHAFSATASLRQGRRRPSTPGGFDVESLAEPNAAAIPPLMPPPPPAAEEIWGCVNDFSAAWLETISLSKSLSGRFDFELTMAASLVMLMDGARWKYDAATGYPLAFLSGFSLYSLISSCCFT